MNNRDKYWEFFTYEHQVAEAIAPIIVDVYPDQVELRTAVLADWLTGQMNCGAIDFAHDPEDGDEPALNESEVTNAFERLFAAPGKYSGSHTVTIHTGEHAGEYDPKALFHEPDPFGFAQPFNIEALTRRVTDALVAAVDSGQVEVTASEPYDSCSNCGGYHNVNYDC